VNESQWDQNNAWIAEVEDWLPVRVGPFLSHQVAMPPQNGARGVAGRVFALVPVSGGYSRCWWFPGAGHLFRPGLVLVLEGAA